MADLPHPFYNANVVVQDKRLYVAGGDSPDKDAIHQVYIYDFNTDRWNYLPPSRHYFGVPHIIGGKLAIIGGRLSATNERTNKVSTFDEGSQSWTSYYPDLLLVRSRPAVASHLEHVIVAGGDRGGSDARITQDDIEVLNWKENLGWKKVSIRLPVPMVDFTLTISDNHLLMVGYGGADVRYSNAYKIPVATITASTLLQ